MTHNARQQRWEPSVRGRGNQYLGTIQQLRLSEMWHNQAKADRLRGELVEQMGEEAFDEWSRYLDQEQVASWPALIQTYEAKMAELNRENGDEDN
jgi:hypothetical protein